VTERQREFLLRCPVTVGERDPAWEIIGQLQRAGLARLEWIGTRIARVWWTDAGSAALQKERA